NGSVGVAFLVVSSQYAYGMIAQIFQIVGVQVDGGIVDVSIPLRNSTVSAFLTDVVGTESYVVNFGYIIVLPALFFEARVSVDLQISFEEGGNTTDDIVESKHIFLISTSVDQASR